MPFHKAISEPDNPYHLDTFYNKKRNFPNAEEREYDDIEPVTVLLTRPDQTIKGVLCSARFKPGTLTCMLSMTKRDLARKTIPFGVGYILTTSERSYRVKDFHLNYYPKYVVVDLEPTSINHGLLFMKALYR